MKTKIPGFLLIAVSLAFGQDSSAGSDKAVPESDAALRARVKQFYSASVTGRWRDAFAVVADDMQDTYLAAPKDNYERCETTRINYTENFTKATVLETCHGEYRWHASRIPADIPLTSTWKFVDGQWYWYHVKPSEVVTPWGISRVTPDQPAKEDDAVSANIAAVSRDPMSLARTILTQVKIDKANVELRSWENSKDEVHIHNGMPGQITLNIDPLALPGLKITAKKTELQANEDAAILFEYRLDDAAITCGECAKHPKSTMTATVRVQPTGQVFPVTITFALPPELEKQLPKELQHSKTKQ